MKYRKKPVVIEAVQLLPDGKNIDEVRAFLKDISATYPTDLKTGEVSAVLISALDGIKAAEVNDYIIKDEYGAFYPCKPDRFEQAYEKVED